LRHRVIHPHRLHSLVERPELIRKLVGAHARVYVPALTAQDVRERRAKVSVESRVDDRVEKTVGVAEPLEKTAERGRYAGHGVRAERPDEREDEERQPTNDERTHDHAEGLRRLTFVRRGRGRAEATPAGLTYLAGDELAQRVTPAALLLYNSRHVTECYYFFSKYPNATALYTRL